jgi:hypothetical protein
MSDLNIRARGLLEFVTQSVEEGLADPSTMAECFSEADQALRILGKTLRKEDEFRHAQLALLGVFDISFAKPPSGSGGRRKYWRRSFLRKRCSRSAWDTRDRKPDHRVERQGCPSKS